MYRRDPGAPRSVASTTVEIPSNFWGASSYGGPAVAAAAAAGDSFHGRGGGGGGGGGSYAPAWGGDQGVKSTSVGGGPLLRPFLNGRGFGGGGGSSSIGGNRGDPGHHRRRSASSASGAGAAGPSAVPAFGGGDLAAFASRVLPAGAPVPPVGAATRQRASDAAPTPADTAAAAAAAAGKEPDATE